MNEESGHLTSEIFQAFLEDALEQGRAEAARKHLSGCARCASELEAWSLLFDELASLPELAPTADFRERVMAQLPLGTRSGAEPAGLFDRLRALVGRGTREASGHLSPDRIQELLDGALGRRARATARTHLEECLACRGELESWSPVFASLDALPRFAPSTGFRERVLAALPARSRVPARSAASSPLLAAARKLVPSTRRGWALTGGLVTAPAIGLAALFAAVVAHPLLTFGDLAAFLSWQIGAALQGGAGWALAQVTESPLLYQLFGIFELVLASPGVAAAGLALLWASMLGAAWILYRNVITPTRTAGRHG